MLIIYSKLPKQPNNIDCFLVMDIQNVSNTSYTTWPLFNCPLFELSAGGAVNILGNHISTIYTNSPAHPPSCIDMY